MIVLAFPPEEAARIVNGEQTVVTYPADLRLTEQLLTPLVVGQMVAIARPCPGCNGEGWHWDECQVCHGKGSLIVGSARVEACVQITDGEWWPKGVVIASGMGTDFTPGRTALILTDAAPCEQRCPSCQDAMPLQTGEPCPACVLAAKGPIPWQQPGPIGEWTP